MRRPPTTSMLQAFASAGRTGNFARTAEELNLTASAVSHQITSLESWWSARLFERHSRGVAITPAGRLMLPIVTSFFERLEQAQAQLTSLAATPLRMHCTSSLCAAWLAPRVHASGSRGVFGRLLLQAIDVQHAPRQDFELAVIMGDGGYPAGDCEFLMRDAMVAVCAPSFRQRDACARVADMVDMPLIHRVDDDICPTWDDWFTFHGVGGRMSPSAPRYPDSNLAISLALRGGGIALGRTALVHEHLQRGALVQVTDAVMPCPEAYHVLAPAARSSPDSVRLTLWLKEQAMDFVTAVRGEFPTLLPDQQGV